MARRNPKRKRFCAVYEASGMKVPLVTRIRPETGRSIRGQGEAGVRPRGGLKGFCVQAFL